MDGSWSYIIAPEGLSQGDMVGSGNSAQIKTGHCLALDQIPVGTTIHCVELYPGAGAQLARSAGASVMFAGKEGKYAILKLSSGEMRKVLLTCKAAIGVVSNSKHNLETIGKAGRSRWLGKRPTVRGVAMNPVDHAMGGGEGRTSGGRHPVNFRGLPAKGKKTRSNKRTDKFIVRGRKNVSRK